ncbi:MAG TPA: hypothetical protein VFL14_06560 [Xanthomonadales bacterium]|nr:hypothetical protein [Xanthomonadales bacterium]
MRLRSLVFLLPGLLAAPATPAAVFTVGSDAACTHGNLLSAISAASTNGAGLDEIRLATNLAYNSIVAPIASHSVTIRGGYSSCSDTTASGRTVLRGTTAGASGTIATSGTAAAYELNVENLELREGGNTTRRGGALRIEGNFIVRLRNSVVTENLAGRGGGIFIDGIDDAELVIDANSIVSSNVAAVSGGGIYCQRNGMVTLDGVIVANTAQDGTGDPTESGNGGGVTLFGCFMNQNASPGLLGVLANTADRHGGGYYLRNAARLFVIGNANAPGRIAENTAGDTGGGIAIYDAPALAQPSEAEIDNSYVDANVAPRGAGIGLVAGGSARSARTRAAGACHNDTLCSTMRDNDYPATAAAGIGCAAYVGPGGILKLRGTRVERNCPRGSGWTFRQGGDSRLELDSTVVADNRGADPFFLEAPFTGALEIGWSTITRNFASLRIGMFSVPSGSINTGSLRVYGTLLGEPFERLITVSGGGGLPPMVFAFDCLVVDTTFTQSVTPYRAIAMMPPYGMAAPGVGNYRLAAGTARPVDWCDQGQVLPRIAGDAGGVATIYDAPIANQFGPRDIGAYEFVVASQPDPLFANGFE